jgi:hypothetical protein
MSHDIILSDDDFKELILQVEGQRFASRREESACHQVGGTFCCCCYFSLSFLSFCCRCYWGLSEGVQVTRFDLAARKVTDYLRKKGIEVTREILDLKHMRESSMTLSEVVDWLLGGHIHFIITVWLEYRIYLCRVTKVNNSPWLPTSCPDAMSATQPGQDEDA